MSAKVSLAYGRYGTRLPVGNSRPTIPNGNFCAAKVLNFSRLHKSAKYAEDIYK